MLAPSSTSYRALESVGRPGGRRKSIRLGQFQVNNCVVLQLHIGVTEFADQFGGVLEVSIRQTLKGVFRASVRFAGEAPRQLAEQSLQHAQPVEGRVIKGERFLRVRTAAAVSILDMKC